MKQTIEVLCRDFSELLNTNPFSTAIYSITSRTYAGWFSCHDEEQEPNMASQFRLKFGLKEQHGRLSNLLCVTKCDDPENEIYIPKSSSSTAVSLSSVKQCNTPPQSITFSSRRIDKVSSRAAQYAQ